MQVSDRQLESLLKGTRSIPAEPDLIVVPDGMAYDVIDRVMRIAMKAGVTKMSFIGNKAYEPEPAPK